MERWEAGAGGGWTRAGVRRSICVASSVPPRAAVSPPSVRTGLVVVDCAHGGAVQVCIHPHTDLGTIFFLPFFCVFFCCFCCFCDRRYRRKLILLRSRRRGPARRSSCSVWPALGRVTMYCIITFFLLPLSLPLRSPSPLPSPLRSSFLLPFLHLPSLLRSDPDVFLSCVLCCVV